MLLNSAIAYQLPFYVGSYNHTWGKPNKDGISYGEINTQTDSISELTLATESANPSYIITTPNIIYAVNETEPGYVSSFSKDSKKLTAFDKINSMGNNAVFMTKSDNNLFIANYGDAQSLNSGIAMLNTINGSMNIITSEIYKQASNSHTHSIYPITINQKKLIYIADLGTDEIHVYIIKNNQPAEIQTLSLIKGSGPRHMAIDTNNNKVYVANEKNSTISILDIDPNTGKLQIIKSIPSYKDEPPKNITNYPAAIMLTDNNQRLYVTNRGLNDITLFTVDSNGNLEYQESFSSHGNWPRDMDIDAKQNYLAVANQLSSNVSFYKINKSNGALSFIASRNINSPATIKFDN